ncbi:unnamed protein product [Polarella glacialis]|uniref:Uncharacterized protein n=1 Tax=Polarella glacialis TaxID=89957 RepID=A0A813L5N5_POLGL|nr:unnamed protein product [Polarella glacialis]
MAAARKRLVRGSSSVAKKPAIRSCRKEALRPRQTAGTGRSAEELDPGSNCASTPRSLKICCPSGGALTAQVGGKESPEVTATQDRRKVGANAEVWCRAREILESEGLVILRGLIPHRVVSAARKRLLQELAEAGALREEARVSAGCLESKIAMPSLLRRLDLQALPQVVAVLEHASLFNATSRLMQAKEVVTTAYKWLRAVPPGTFTGPHMDRAYVGDGRRLTAWIPFGKVEAGEKALGSLCWIPGSHRDPSVIERYKDYRRAGTDGERSGWLAADPGALELPPSCSWRSADFAPGDVAVFGMDLLHTTVPNGTDSFRISCDTRWQPLGDPPPAEVVVGPWRRSRSRKSL